MPLDLATGNATASANKAVILRLKAFGSQVMSAVQPFAKIDGPTRGREN